MEFLNDVAEVIGVAPEIVAGVGAIVAGVIGWIAGKKRERKKGQRQIRL